MRKTQLSNGRVINIRPLTRREIREDLAELGFGIMRYAVGIDAIEKAVQKVLEIQGIDEDVIGPLPPGDSRKIYLETIRETYGDEGEEKNSPTPGPGAQAKSSASDAPSVENGTSN